jgi:hypothetical protein
MAATVEESTPPDMATAIVLLGSLGMVLQFYFLRVARRTPPPRGYFALALYFQRIARFQQDKIFIREGLRIKILFLKEIAPAQWAGAISFFFLV